uniref:Uncharacterized protein LOC114341835 n=1 Tax=Diabrotica virgifera virgifera TaxID=50390 RepID=A0A6P7GQX8_DIAVI
MRNFAVRYSTLEKTLSEYEEIFQDIVILKQEMDLDAGLAYHTHLYDFYDLYSNIEYLASLLINKPAVLSNNPNSTNNSTIKMPKFELVKFDGEDNISLWPVFYENFKQFVHNKIEYPKSDKLQYLLSCISGNALKSCSSIEPIPNNYDIIWNMLVERYNDKKYLFNLYMDRIVNFRGLQSNNPSYLEIFLEKFDTNVSALKRLNLDNLDDHILTYLAMLKLPQDTIDSFDLIRNNNDLPAYDDLLKFLRQRSKSLIKNDRSRNSKNNFSFQKPNKSFHLQEQNTYSSIDCVVCKKGPHLIKD